LPTRHAEPQRVYRGLSEGEAQELARRRGESLPARRVRRAEPSAIPEALRKAADAIRELEPRRRNVPGFLRLIADQWERAERPVREVEIPFGDIIKYCHRNEHKIQLRTIRMTTITPSRSEIDRRGIPLSLELTKNSVIVALCPEVGGGSR